MEVSSILHIRIKLLFAVAGAVGLSLKGAQTDQALIGRALEARMLPEQFHEPSALHLPFESLLQAIIALVAASVCMDSHCGGRVG